MSTGTSRRAAPADGPTGGRGLLERESVLDAIADVVSAVERGGSGCLLIEGPAGIGKTSVLAHAVAARSSALDVRRATGDDLESQHPWGLTRQLFAGLDLADLVGDAALAAPVFVPQTSSAGGGSHDLFPLLHGLHFLTADLAEQRPLLFVLDDLQWADPQTLRLLTYVLNRMDDLALGLLLAVRSGVPTPDETTALLTRIAASPHTVTRSLDGLSRKAVSDLVRMADPDASDGFCTAVAQATGGNPFLCQELLSAVRSEGIELTDDGIPRLADLTHTGIRRAILVRLGQLGHQTATVASAAAVLGPACSVARIAAVTGLARSVARHAVDLLIDADLLHARGDHVDFVHPVIRETVHADIGPARRGDLHGRVARLLLDEGAPPSDVATHLLAAAERPDAWAVPVLRDGAAEAMTQGAPEQAVALLRMALDAEPDAARRTRVLVELGRAEAAAGAISGADRFKEALSALASTPDDAAIARDLGEALYAAGHYRDALRAFDRGLEALDDAPEPRGGSLLEAQLISGLELAGTLSGVRHPRVAAHLAAHAPVDAERSLATRALLALAAARRAFGFGVPPEEHRHAPTVELATAALDGGPLPLELGLVVLEPLALSLYITRRLGEATELLDRLIETAVQHGALPRFTSLMTVRGQVHLAAGRLDAAAQDGRDALRLSTEFPGGNAQTEAVARSVLAQACLLTGDLAAAEDALAVAEPARRWGDSVMFAWYLDAHGHLELERGNAEAALRDFSEAGARFLAPGGTGGHTAWRLGAAEALTRLGRDDDATGLVTEELRRAREFGAPGPIGTALCASARRLPDHETLDVLTQARELIPDDALLDRARVEVDLGATLRRLGRRTEARVHLRAGRTAALECAAAPLAERAAAELRLTGARRPEAPATGVAALTPAELRVAGHAARGLSNPEIAATLFVTRKTVEVHLSACYRKLGIRSRDELADALG